MSLIQSAAIRWYDAKVPTNDRVILDSVARIRPHVDHMFVAIRTSVDLTGSLAKLQALGDPGIHAFAMEPWYDRQFSCILNQLMFVAARQYGVRQMLSLSAEVVIPESVLHALAAEYATGDVMAVGSLLPGHEFDPGEGAKVHTMRGKNIPWNQCRLLNLPLYLDAFGFWMGGDSAYNPDAAGVEELGTDSANQEKHTAERARVILLQTDELVDVVQGHVQPDAERFAWNAVGVAGGKLDTKDSRSAAQMARVPNLKPGRVVHKLAK